MFSKKMKTLIIILHLISLINYGYALRTYSTNPKILTYYFEPISHHYPSSEFNTLNTKIRNNQISKKDALTALKKIIPKIKEHYFSRSQPIVSDNVYIFPLEGYSNKSIGGKGSGYITKGYDYFDGNKHKAHPAHDIFINDRNQSTVDDKTKKPVNVLAFTKGIVVATENIWQPTSKLRGGRYIYIYNPETNSLYYYAHLNQINVKTGDIIQAGAVIGTVGRTGYNAFKKRSPTHLHFMILEFDKKFYPRAVNGYDFLMKSAKK